MQTKQPKWKLIANLGDVSCPDYDGFFVFIDETRVYEPEALLVNVIAGESHNWKRTSPYAECYRLILEKCTYENNILSDNPYHKDYEVWFAKHLPDIASTIDESPDILIKQFCSDDARERALAYRTLTHHFSPQEFDYCPRIFKTYHELANHLHDLGAIKIDHYEYFYNAHYWDLISLLKQVQKSIRADYRASDDPEDDAPGTQITIATNNELSDWTYQTGDNSFSGDCYHYPHWGVGSLYKTDDPEAIEDLADTLLCDLLEQVGTTRSITSGE